MYSVSLPPSSDVSCLFAKCIKMKSSISYEKLTNHIIPISYLLQLACCESDTECTKCPNCFDTLDGLYEDGLRYSGGIGLFFSFTEVRKMSRHYVLSIKIFPALVWLLFIITIQCLMWMKFATYLSQIQLIYLICLKFLKVA